jgi:hypothetical protein
MAKEWTGDMTWMARFAGSVAGTDCNKQGVSDKCDAAFHACLSVGRFLCF